MDIDSIKYSFNNGVWRGQFHAMASDCEILIECATEQQAQKLVSLAAKEVWRIERKYSRYRGDSVVARINQCQPITLDEETSKLIDFAFQCYEMSQGMFDITSGVLQRAWRFDGKTPFPSKQAIAALLKNIGLNKVSWRKPTLCLRPDMQLDFGGFGKEYATDRALRVITEQQDCPTLVNLGGDLVCNKPPSSQPCWQIGIAEGEPNAIIELKSGGLATSGVTRRYILHQSKRYGHILNPLSGWPIENPPLSVTVSAPNCTQAGLLATLAMLHGEKAESFLQQQGCLYKIYSPS